MPLSAPASNPLLFDAARLSAAASAASAAASSNDLPCIMPSGPSARSTARLSICEVQAALVSLQVSHSVQERKNADSELRFFPFLNRISLQLSMASVHASHNTQIEEVSRHCTWVPCGSVHAMILPVWQCTEHLKSLKALYAALAAAVASLQQ